MIFIEAFIKCKCKYFFLISVNNQGKLSDVFTLFSSWWTEMSTDVWKLWVHFHTPLSVFNWNLNLIWTIIFSTTLTTHRKENFSILMLQAYNVCSYFWQQNIKSNSELYSKIQHLNIFMISGINCKFEYIVISFHVSDAYTRDQVLYIWKHGYDSVKISKDVKLSQFDLQGHPISNYTSTKDEVCYRSSNTIV